MSTANVGSEDEAVTVPLGHGVELVLRGVAVTRLRAQLAEGDGDSTEESARQPVALPEHHPMWEHHSGGTRHQGPEWGEGDASSAKTLLMDLSAKARIFFELLLDRPGQLLDTDEIMVRSPGEFSSSKAIAGCLNGFVNPCTRSDRRFPFYWWERADGPTRYAVKPSVARVFTAAQHHEIRVTRPPGSR